MSAWVPILERLQPVHSEIAARALLRRLAKSARQARKPRVLAFVNAHALNLAAESAAFARALSTADVLLRDGAGLALLLRRCGRPAGVNMNGTDFIPQLLRACDGLPVSVLGTREPYLERGLTRMQRDFVPRSAVWGVDGFQPSTTYLHLLRERRPSLVLLAMGMPRQEELAQWLRSHLDHGCLLVCGGAIVDFLAGRTRRAPALLQRLGMEWLWRLSQEPVRLFKRYVIGNPLFLWRTWQLRLDRSSADSRRR
ncbi:MAG: WecB/TagA/CpsF family glycosyltransferase [Betaproteobacteria bacterium]